MRQELIELAGRIAPELGSQPFYVVEADEPGLPGEFRLYGTLGLYSPFNDLALREWG